VTAPPKLMMFDVFGTVVDWRTSIIGQLTQLGDECGLDLDWANFADDWRGLYQPAMEKVRSGQRHFVLLDVLQRENLIALLASKDRDLPGDEMIERMNRVWHRLDGWPDAAAGLARLRELSPCVALSNGHVGLMASVARHAGLQWDAILGAEFARAYKPDRHVYLGAAQSFALEPDECLMVAAHNSDLAAARTLGFKTAFVLRAQEYGAAQSSDLEPEQDWDYVVSDFNELATGLGG